MYKFDPKKHIHTLDDKPLIGTSTVMGVVAKPLTWWASGLACSKLGWTNKGNAKTGFVPLEQRIRHAEPFLAEIKGFDSKQYLELLDEAYKAHSVKLDTSAQSGTDMHAVMEDYVNQCLNQNNGAPIVLNGQEDEKLTIFANWAIENVKRFLWSESHCYSQELWVGGISDCGFEDKDGKYGIIDFKSSKEAYVSQFMQIAGYDLEISESGLLQSDGSLYIRLDKPISYYCVLPFGMEKPEVCYSYDVEELKNGFKSALVLYKIINGAEKE